MRDGLPHRGCQYADQDTKDDPLHGPLSSQKCIAPGFLPFQAFESWLVRSTEVDVQVRECLGITKAVRHTRWNKDDISSLDCPLDAAANGVVDDRTASHQVPRAVLHEVDLDDALVDLGSFGTSQIAGVQTVGASLQESRRDALLRPHVGELCLQRRELEVKSLVGWRLMACEGATASTATGLGEADGRA